MPIAIITGAFSGLGAQWVETVISEAPAITEIWLVARRRERLESIAAAHPERTFHCVAVDLSSEEGIAALAAELEREEPHVALLINNAGVIHPGDFSDADPAALRAQVLLDAAAPVGVSRACLPHMRSGSVIINVGSVSGFAPVRNQVVYAASKSFVYELSLGLRAELARDGINVLVLCPGNMLTEMNTGPTEAGGVGERLPYLDLPRITKEALRLARAGRAVYTPHPVYKGYRLLAKLAPYQLVARLASR